MKISTLLETPTTSVGTNDTQAPRFGRSDEMLESGSIPDGAVDMTGKSCEKCKKGDYQETSQHDDMDGVLHCTKCGNKTNRWKNYKEKVEESTTSGSVASVAAPIGGVQKRGQGSMFAGIKTSKKFPNSEGVAETSNPAQQAAIAISKKKKQSVAEGSDTAPETVGKFLYNTITKSLNDINIPYQQGTDEYNRFVQSYKKAMADQDRKYLRLGMEPEKLAKYLGIQDGAKWIRKAQGVAEGSVSLTGSVLQWPEVVNKISSAMKAMGWKSTRKDDGAFLFSIKGQETDDQWYIVIIDNAGKGNFRYALGTVEEGDSNIGEKDTLPNTDASISELMMSIREGFGLNEGDDMVLDEKSKSKAQFRMMAAVAHNPKFAKKVGISPKVGKEFHSADKKQDYKSLPKKVDEAEFTEDKLANDLYKDLQIFKKGTDKEIGSKAKDKEIGNKPSDKEVQQKKMSEATKEADYGSEYQDMVKRVGDKAKQGPMKTVWDEKTRKYKVVPVNAQKNK